MVCADWRGFSGLGILSSGSRSRGCPLRFHPAWSSAAQAVGLPSPKFLGNLEDRTQCRASSRPARPQSGRQITPNCRTYPVRLSDLLPWLLRQRRPDHTTSKPRNDGIRADQGANVPDMLAPSCTTVWRPYCRQSRRAPRSCCTGGPAHCPHPDSGRVKPLAPPRPGRGCPSA